MEKFLIIGLGNPGAEYAHTRHNIGFDTLDALATKLGTSFGSESFGWVAKTRHKGKIIILLKPNTFMNLSGKAFAHWMKKENVTLPQTLTVTDDIALPLGKLRLKMKGSDGGHNGLANIIQCIGSQDFPRLRFGVGNNFPKGRQVDFVLGKWTAQEEETVKNTIDRAVDGIISFMLAGPERTMNVVNT